jgi:glycerophosphoryl diester phosphodiesterase
LIRLTRIFAACAASLAAGVALSQVTLIERQSLSGAELGAPTGAKLKLQLAVVRLEGSGWSRVRSLAVLREAAGILAQCGVAVDRAELQSLAAPNYLDFSTPAARELARAHPVSRPAIYLVRDTKRRPAFDAEAIGRGNSTTRPELADTVWMTAATREPGVALAHELAHVLMDSGEHSEAEGNLMREDTSARNVSLSAAQCARLRETGSRNGLLDARHGVVGRDSQRAHERKPIVIGHRGASGYVPEHTLVAYFIAIQMGADYIEPDLVMTRDGVLVARHENEIGGTTDVADRPEFARRRTTKTIDGAAVAGWFTEDFTLAELKTLRAKERIPQIRPSNTRFDGMFEVPTLQEVLGLVQRLNSERRREAKGKERKRFKPVGVYPETKHPTYFAGIGLAMEEPLVRILHRHGYRGRHASALIQSFEVGNLKRLARMTDLPLVQLLNDVGRPYDFTVSGDPRTYSDLAKPAGLADIARYAAGVGVNKNLMIPRAPMGFLGAPTALVADAHARGLVVHGWTFRAENTFLPTDFQSGADPIAFGDLVGEAKRFLELGMDGFFTDQSDIGVRARDEFVAAH